MTDVILGTVIGLAVFVWVAFWIAVINRAGKRLKPGAKQKVGHGA